MTMIAQTENFSIIIPTLREAKNISILINRIASLFISFQQLFEVIIVDDCSQDGIEMVVAQLQRQFHWLRLIVRRDSRSLSASALEGFSKAQYPLLVLMDADLSHPPEKIPEMLAALASPEVDFVIGSRYVLGGSTDAIWSVPRKVISRFSAWFAQLLLPLPIKDPLSGFFAFRKASLAKAEYLNPVGWKIGLEIMLKCHCKQIKEIPIHFSDRLYGKSKLSIKVISEYLRHMSRLVFYKIFS